MDLRLASLRAYRANIQKCNDEFLETRTAPRVQRKLAIISMMNPPTSIYSVVKFE